MRAATLTLRTPPAQTAFTERRNSTSSGIRTRQSCGFFVPDVHVGRAAAIQQRFGAKAARRLLAVSTLPTPTGLARRNVSPWSIRPVGDVI